MITCHMTKSGSGYPSWVSLDAVEGAELDTQRGIGMSKDRHGERMEAEHSLELPSSQRKSEERVPMGQF